MNENYEINKELFDKVQPKFFKLLCSKNHILLWNIALQFSQWEDEYNSFEDIYFDSYDFYINKINVYFTELEKKSIRVGVKIEDDDIDVDEDKINVFDKRASYLLGKFVDYGWAYFELGQRQSDKNFVLQPYTLQIVDSLQKLNIVEENTSTYVRYWGNITNYINNFFKDDFLKSRFDMVLNLENLVDQCHTLYHHLKLLLKEAKKVLRKLLTPNTKVDDVRPIWLGFIETVFKENLMKLTNERISQYETYVDKLCSVLYGDDIPIDTEQYVFYENFNYVDYMTNVEGNNLSSDEVISKLKKCIEEIKQIGSMMKELWNRHNEVDKEYFSRIKIELDRQAPKVKLINDLLTVIESEDEETNGIVFNSVSYQWYEIKEPQIKREKPTICSKVFISNADLEEQKIKIQAIREKEKEWLRLLQNKMAIFLDGKNERSAREWRFDDVNDFLLFQDAIRFRKSYFWDIKTKEKEIIEQEKIIFTDFDFIRKG